MGLDLSHILVNVYQKQVKDVKFHTNSQQMKGEEHSRPQYHLVPRPSCHAERNTPDSCRTEHRAVPGLGIGTGFREGVARVLTLGSSFHQSRDVRFKEATVAQQGECA